jgi:hypothetical protein
MSNTPTPENSQLLSQIIGAGLAIVGGFFAVIFRLRIERREEVNHIKISIVDELDEVRIIIAKLEETYKATNPHFINNTYLNDLAANTESFNFHKQKLFLISNQLLRKEIATFYKKLSESINGSINTVGQLGGNQIGTDHDKIVEDFSKLSVSASGLSAKIKKYQYKVLWLF